MKIIPNLNMVVVQIATKKELENDNIKLPEGADYSNRIGIVVSTNPEKDNLFQKGDRILFGEYNKEDIIIDEQEYFVIDRKKILGKIQKSIK